MTSVVENRALAGLDVTWQSTRGGGGGRPAVLIWRRFERPMCPLESPCRQPCCGVIGPVIGAGQFETFRGAALGTIVKAIARNGIGVIQAQCVPDAMSSESACSVIATSR